MNTNYLRSIFSAAGILLFGSLAAQTVSTAETLVLASETYWNGSDQTGGFVSGNCFFANTYDTTYAYWSSGWAYSNRTDSAVVASSSAQLFTATAGSGYLSNNYMLGQQGSIIRLTGAAAGGVVSGMYVTNSAFAYNSMTFGDFVAKQFGGSTGNDPDFFKLTVRKFDNGLLANDTVVFYLSDFRFANNAQDYIVRNWTWLDLTPLGNCDSLEFELNSSDVGAFGINTPTFFCIDNFTTLDSPVGISEAVQSKVSVWPNPFVSQISIARESHAAATVSVTDAAGRIVYTRQLIAEQETIDLSFLASGVYVLTLVEGNHQQVQQIIK